MFNYKSAIKESLFLSKALLPVCLNNFHVHGYGYSSLTFLLSFFFFLKIRDFLPGLAMVSLEESQSTSTRLPITRTLYSSAKIQRSLGRSMRTVRSNYYKSDRPCSFADSVADSTFPENLTDSVVDLHLGELAAKTQQSSTKSFFEEEGENFLELSHAFSDFSACSSDISGELQRLATIPSSENPTDPNPDVQNQPCTGFLDKETFSTEIIESISPEDLQPTVKICIDGLQSPSIAVKRSAAAKLRLLAKNRADNRALIGESGAVPALIPLLRSSDPWTQEHAVTALLNLSLHEGNTSLITTAGAIKSLVYVLKTGTATSKQNAACCLLNLSLIEENKATIGVCGAIPPLVSLLINGSSRGKKDALTALYKLCSANMNKERAIAAGAVKALVELVADQGNGMSEKAMVVLSSLAAIAEGKESMVEEGGIPVLVEAMEDGSGKGKEFAVVTLLQLCGDSSRNRGVLVREGGIPPLIALSQNGTAKAKHKAEALLKYLRREQHG